MLDITVPEGRETPLYGRIADAVCVAVAEGRAAPGDRLPTESALASKLGINLLTVSRAYDHLKDRGIIRQRRGSGTYVAPDAVDRARRWDETGIRNLLIVLGEDSPTKCPHQTFFVVADLVEGIRDGLGSSARRLTFVENLTAPLVRDIAPDDAVLSIVHSRLDEALVAGVVQRQVRFVSVWDAKPLAGVPHVDYDRHGAASLACRHLVECGYRKIGFIGLRKHWRSPVAPKFGAFTTVLHDGGLDVHARFVREVNTLPGKAYAATQDVLRSGDSPDAFFVDTDYKAMEVVCALNDAGLKVPDDIGIVSYDDAPDAALFDPPLTTVRIPRREIGRRAARMLLDWPRDGSRPTDVVLPSELMVRGSTRPPAATGGVQPAGGGCLRTAVTITALQAAPLSGLTTALR